MEPTRSGTTRPWSWDAEHADAAGGAAVVDVDLVEVACDVDVDGVVAPAVTVVERGSGVGARLVDELAVVDDDEVVSSREPWLAAAEATEAIAPHSTTAPSASPTFLALARRRSVER